MYLHGYGYGWGGTLGGDPSLLPFSRLIRKFPDFKELPEEVREVLEGRVDEISSAEDLRRIAGELMERR